jgi:hypothetical protein
VEEWREDAMNDENEAVTDEQAGDTGEVVQTESGTDEESRGEARAAWQDVISQLDELGEAMGRWARAAVNDPDAKRHAEQFSEQMEIVADKVSTAVDDASKSDVGQQFKDAAAKTGEAFRKAGETVSAEVAPRMASAFRSAAEGLHQAAQRMETKESASEEEPGDEGGARAPSGGSGDAGSDASRDAGDE